MNNQLKSYIKHYLKNSKKEKSMQDLETICGQQIYLLCVIDVFTKYVWVEPLKDKNNQSVLNAFIEIVNECNCKPNKFMG